MTEPSVQPAAFTALGNLVADEIRDARGDARRLSALVERLGALLGLTVAVAAQGDPRIIDTLLAGAEAYAHREAVEKSKVLRLLKNLDLAEETDARSRPSRQTTAPGGY